MFTIINAHSYDIGKLNAKQQFHVLRKLAPLITHVPALLPLAHQFKTKGDAASENAVLENSALLQAIGPVASAFAELPEKDADYVIHTCLGVVRRQAQGGTGYCGLVTTGGDLMFEGMPMLEMLTLVVHVLRESLGDFFSALPKPSREAAETSPPAAG